jgi:hypothetical protein
LLDAFFTEVQSKAEPQVLEALVPAMLVRLKAVYKVPGYQEAVCRYVEKYILVVLQENEILHLRQLMLGS